jgi:hypothetical protein
VQITAYILSLSGLCVWPATSKLFSPSMVASAGETDRDLAGTQFPRN